MTIIKYQPYQGSWLKLLLISHPVMKLVYKKSMTLPLGVHAESSFIACLKQYRDYLQMREIQMQDREHY